MDLQFCIQLTYQTFLPEDFENKKFDNIDSKWPISYNELKKYYEKNEKILGIAGLSGDASYPDVIKNLLPPVKLGAAVCKLAVAFEKLGWHWWPSYSGVITKKIDYRKLGTIVEPNNSYWPKALKNNVKLYTETKVLKIISTRNKVTCIEYLDSKKKLNRKYAKIIILACSGIGTPRLLLNSKNKYFPKGLANKSGLVGKNLMLHPLAWIEESSQNSWVLNMAHKVVLFIVLSLKRIKIFLKDILFKY